MTNMRKVNAEKGKKGFQKTENAQSGTSVGSLNQAVGGDAHTVASDFLDGKFQSIGFDPNPNRIPFNDPNPCNAVLENVDSLKYLEDGSGVETYTLAYRLERASELAEHGSRAATVYSQASADLLKRLRENDIEHPAFEQHTVDRFDGYRTTKLHERMGREGMSFDCVVTRSGKPVGHVENDGNGGPDSHYFEKMAEKNAFLARTKLLTTETFEPEGYVVNDMNAAFTIGRKKGICITFAGDNFAETGSFRVFSPNPGETRAQALNAIRNDPRFADKGMQIWDKDAADFIPIANAR